MVKDFFLRELSIQSPYLSSLPRTPQSPPCPRGHWQMRKIARASGQAAEWGQVSQMSPDSHRRAGLDMG